MYQILLPFREELKQRIWGRGLSWEGPVGFCLVPFGQLKSSDPTWMFGRISLHTQFLFPPRSVHTAMFRAEVFWVTISGSWEYQLQATLLKTCPFCFSLPLLPFSFITPASSNFIYVFPTLASYNLILPLPQPNAGRSEARSPILEIPPWI